jgi:hypothetical protein
MHPELFFNARSLTKKDRQQRDNRGEKCSEKGKTHSDDQVIRATGPATESVFMDLMARHIRDVPGLDKHSKVYYGIVTSHLQNAMDDMAVYLRQRKND